MKILTQKISSLIGIIFLLSVVVLGVIFIEKNNTKGTPQSIFGPILRISKTGLVVINPLPESQISSPLKITGYVNGDGWTGFEGQVGNVKLLDSAGNALAAGILAATTEWTKLPTNFEVTLNFQSTIAQLGTLVFKNENPSGLQEKDKEFILPVKIPKVETMMVSVFFNVIASMENYECNNVFAVNRFVPKTSAPARAALEELLKGPTETEKSQYFTSINSGVKIQSLTIENGVAKADFDEQLEYQVGGSCRVAAIRAQITQTLKQFSTVKNVVISINGRTEDILQP